MIKNLGLFLAAVALLATAACGGSDSSSTTASGSASSSASTSASASGGGRPTTTELSSSLQSGNKFGSSEVKLPRAKADCAAKLLVGSDLSDEALTAILKADNSYQGDQKDTAALTKIRTKFNACLN